jgi:hypothetical protein
MNRVTDPSSGHDKKKYWGHDSTSVMTQKDKLGHDRDPGRDKVPDTNYIFLEILGRPGHDPSSGHDSYWAMTGS